MARWRYFSDAEVAGLDPVMVQMLDNARHICGFPFKITSGKRTIEENAKAGGVGDSSHVDGLAVDLATPKEQDLREKMVWALGLVGFRRIGIYDKHFHVDVDAKKKQDVAWFGKSH